MKTVTSLAEVRRLGESYVFSQDWFSQHAQTWDHLLARLRPLRLLEIGCYEGRASSYLIERCTEFNPVHLTCVDTWIGSVDLPTEAMAGVEERFDHNINRAIMLAPMPVNLRKIKLASTAALARLIAAGEEQFDFIYIDGSHTAPDVLTDAILAFQLLRRNGIMVFDDYLWCMEPPFAADPLNMPKPAIDAFTTIFTRKVRVLAGLPNSQCYVEKIAS